MDLSWQTGYHRYRRYFVNLGQISRQKKVQVYTGIVLSILASAFFLFFAIKPTLVTIASLIKEIKDKKIVVAKLETKINDLASAQQEYQTIAADLILVDQALPQESHMSLLVGQLETLSAAAGVGLESVNYSTVNLMEVEKKKEPQEISFSFSASGSYQNLRTFLQSIISLRRIILINGFSFKKGKSEGQPLVLTVYAKAYFLEQTK